MPPPPGIIFPPGIPPAASPAAAAPSLTSTEEIWVENKSPEGKVLYLVSSLASNGNLLYFYVGGKVHVKVDTFGSVL